MPSSSSLFFPSLFYLNSSASNNIAHTPFRRRDDPLRLAFIWERQNAVQLSILCTINFLTRDGFETTQTPRTWTPKQLARKRKKDREASRATRVRTKEHNDRPERELKDLKSKRSQDQTIQMRLQRTKTLEDELTAQEWHGRVHDLFALLHTRYVQFNKSHADLKASGGS